MELTDINSVRRFVTVLVVTILTTGCGAPTAPSATGVQGDTLGNVELFVVDVMNGYGGGSYAPGTTVHVFGGLDPTTEVFLGWGGDQGLLRGGDEWHATFTMPDTTVRLIANFGRSVIPLIAERFRGAPGRVEKDLLFSVPTDPVGLILLNHGTGGSANMIRKEEAAYFRLVALERGFGVVAFEAEESEAGDLNGDDKQRWDVTPDSANLDLHNVSALVQHLRDRSLIDASTPLYAVGMSNGGVFSISLGAVAATPSSSVFPLLRFAAVVSYCAPGAAYFANLTATPTAWLMCAQDTNPTAVANGGSAKAQLLSNVLLGRGVASLFDSHGPSPLYAERLARVEEIDLATSVALVTAFGQAGYLDKDGFVIEAPDVFLTEVNDRGIIAAWVGLSGAAKLGVRSQLRATYADHQFYSDWASRTLDFLEDYGPGGIADRSR